MKSRTNGMFRALVLLMMTSLLAACGGGGGGGFSTADSISVTLTAERTTLPLNPSFVGVSRSGFYTTEIIAEAKRADGSPVSDGTNFQFIATNSASAFMYSLLAEDFDEETGHGAFATYPNESAAGKASMFIHAWETVGEVTVSVSVFDPASGETVAASVVIKVGDATGTETPGDIYITSATSVLFTQGLNGPINQILQVRVADEVDNAIVDPVSGTNNVRAEIVFGPGGGELLVGTDAMGNDQQRDEISVPTVNGVATFSLRAGSLPGTVVILFTADRADNNVDNGIATAISNVAATSIVTAYSNEPIEIITEEDALAEGTVGFFYIGVIESEGGVPPYTYSLAAGALPPGLSLNESGVIFGTATQAGEFPFIIQAIGLEVNKVDTQNFTITIAAPEPIKISPDSLDDVEVGGGFAVAFSAEGGVAPYTWEHIAGSLPPGLSFNAANGIISGTTSSAGTYAFAISVTDVNGLSTSLAYSITVTEPEPEPEPEPVEEVTLTVNAEGDYGFTQLESGLTTITFLNDGTGASLIVTLDGGALFTGTADFEQRSTLPSGNHVLAIVGPLDGWTVEITGPIE